MCSLQILTRMLHLIGIFTIAFTLKAIYYLLPKVYTFFSCTCSLTIIALSSFRTTSYRLTLISKPFANLT